MTIDEAWDVWLNAQPTMSRDGLKDAKRAFYAAFAAGAGEHAQLVDGVVRAARNMVKELGDQGDLFFALTEAVEKYDAELKQ
jgi:hypothetical protein